MNCAPAQLNLKAYVDRELGLWRRAAVAAHMRRCGACREDARAIRSLSHQLAALPAPSDSGRLRMAVLAAACEACPQHPRSRVRSFPRWLFGAAGLVVAVGALAVFLTSRPTAAAAALEQVIAAAEQVQTCHMVVSRWQPGAPRETAVFWYANGKWRIEDWQRGKQVRVQVYDGDRSHHYNIATNTVFLNTSDQPFGTPFRGFTVRAMLSPDLAGPDSQVKLFRTRGADGRRLNRFVVTGTQERFVIVADATSDLPVSLKAYGRLQSRWVLALRSELIEYNVSLHPALFTLTPPPDAGVVDMARVTDEWFDRYERGIARATVGIEKVVLRDFQITTAGDVFVIVTASPIIRLTDVSLQDSLHTRYIRVQEGFQAGSDPCALFVPLAPPGEKPSWYDLTVNLVLGGEGNAGRQDQANFHVTRPVLSPGPDPLFPSEREYYERRPGASAFLYPSGAALALTRAELRAEYWRKRGDLRRALRHFEEAVRIADTEFHPRYLNAWTWVAIAQTYEQARMRSEAHWAYQRGIEALTGEEGRQTVEALRAGLRRTR